MSENSIDTQPEKKTTKAIKLTVLVCVLFMCAVLTLFLNKMLSPRVLSDDQLRANGAITFNNPRIIRELKLIDHTGQPFSLSQLKNKWTLIYFGFTFCPDICPTTLMRLNEVMESLDEDIAKNTQVLMVTVDPARDTPEVLNKYINYFNEDFIGVTGEFINVKRFASDVNVAFNKVILEEGNYTVDHTGNLILINPYGHYHGFFKPPFELARLKLTIQSIVTSFKPE